jgi:SAM-dependent methyltransferase
MTKFTDHQYLLTEQYRTATTLNARIALHERFGTNQYPWPRWLFDHLAPPAPGRILELGCGPGSLWHDNADRIPASWLVILSDFSLGMIAEARHNLGDLAHPFGFACADAQAIPFARGSFDVVIANHMLYHVPDRAQAYAEIRRVLRPGGRLYAATNGQGNMRELGDLARQFDPVLFDRPGEDRSGFTLEGGTEELAHWFASVTLHQYDDALVVTEAEPLVTYLLSGTSFTGGEHVALAADRRAQLAAFVQSAINAQGAIHITKEMGAFEAIRGDEP